MKRYEALAADIAASIESGTLKAGDKLPSVRQLRASRKASPATVFEAYALLEARGLIESRPRSGYYVSRPARAMPAEPLPHPAPDGEPRAVQVADMIYGILQAAASHDVVPLGSAFPSPFLFPLQRLGRALAASATRMGCSC